MKFKAGDVIRIDGHYYGSEWYILEVDVVNQRYYGKWCAKEAIWYSKEDMEQDSYVHRKLTKLERALK